MIPWKQIKCLPAQECGLQVLVCELGPSQAMYLPTAAGREHVLVLV